MKRRVVITIAALALCLSLCLTWALAAGLEPDAGLCPHHQVHTQECGYVPEDAGAPCAFVCRLCPIEDLIGKLPGRVTPNNKSQVEDQLNAILALYTELTADEQDQLDLSLCLDLQAQLDAANTPMPLGGVPDFTLTEPYIVPTPPHIVGAEWIIDTADYSFTAEKSTAIRVQSQGVLYLKGSSVTSQNGAGVEVLTGGSLFIEDPNLVVTGTTYGLDISSGATVQLSGGTFTGTKAAIRTSGNNFSALLKDGSYAYFDASGRQLEPDEIAGETTVVIKRLTEITWNRAAEDVDYNGSPVAATVLPSVTITPGNAGLESYIEYFYKKEDADDSTYTKGLPTNAGTYSIVARLPELPPNYSAASSEPITLTINKIPALTTAPAAIELTYNRTHQELVTGGALKDGAAAEGAVIEFAAREDGPYSQSVPTGLNAGSYTVYYKVNDTLNYTGVAEGADEAKVAVTIDKKPITPTIELSEKSYVHDGRRHEPKITVKDEETELVVDQDYTISWGESDWTSASTHTATIASTGKNYTFDDKTAEVEIVAASQNALSITGQPSVVHYGDTIQLGTTGGTGSGTVTWSIAGASAADDWITSGGLLTVKNVGGPITVTAKRSSTGGNYSEISATWEFNADKKPVTAVLTGVDRDYKDNDKTATVKAEVGSNDLVGNDSITIPNLSGTFEDANVGTNKKITVTPPDSSKVTGAEKYAITYPKTATASIRPVAATVRRAPTASSQTYDASKDWPLVSAGTATGGTMLYSLNGTDYSRNIPTAKNAGTYKVYYKAQGDSNHTDSGVGFVEAEIKQQTVTPTVELKPSSAQYDGSVKQPTTITVRDGKGYIIPDSEYKATYDATVDWKDVGSYNVTIKNLDGGNYVVNQATETFTITAAEQNPLEITDKPGLVHFGDAPFTLSAVGGSGNGAITWSSDPVSVATVDANGLVTIKGAGKVTITATKAASTNYTETTATYQFTVAQKSLAVDVELTLREGGCVYNGAPQTPGVTVTADGTELKLNDDYTVAYSNNTEAGTGTTKPAVTVKANPNSNYKFDDKTVEFEIKKAEAKVTLTRAEGLTYSGGGQALISEGATNFGTIKYCLSENGEYSTDVPTGTNRGTYTVWYKVEGTSNYDGASGKIENIQIAPKTITATVEVSPLSCVFNESEQKPTVTVTVNEGGTELVINQDYTISWGESDWKSVGTHTVEIIATDNGNYEFEAVRKDFIIDPKQATVTVIMPDGWKEDDSGKRYYEQDGNVKKPAVTVKDGEIEIDSEQYTISWGGGDWTSAGTYTVTVTAKDGGNYTFEKVTAQVEIRVVESEESGGSEESEESGGSEESSGMSSQIPSGPSSSSSQSAPMQTSVRNGTATTVMSASAGSTLVKQAVANQSKNVVIEPEVAGEVTKAEVSIPASTVSQLHSETDADLTVSTPIAAVTIPNGALDTLSSAGGAVSVVTERAENAVTLTLAADGETVESVPGGVTLTVPVEDAAPGTVAVLVRDDGTRETFRKAVPENGELSVLLDGSATVEIVDNSKEFSDVSDTDWEADAVAFASAHELFSGTSETTFSPDEPISRGMLATVLYNLEGRPAQSATGEFSDVGSDAWYAEGVSWAAENGITDGYGDGRFGPNDSITREQLAVMLWKYAGSPAADDQELNFTDADQASDYAAEALRWAVANGILNGYGNGQLDPGGLATRAQAAQMLKNFMENT